MMFVVKFILMIVVESNGWWLIVGLSVDYVWSKWDWRKL